MRKYAKDYELERKEDEKGRIKKTTKYIGDYFEVRVELHDLIKFRRIAFLLLLIVVGMHISAGFVGNQGMFQFYIALPYVFVFLPLYFFAAGILRLPKEKRAFRRDEVDLSFSRAKKASVLMIVLLGVVLVGGLVFLIGFAEGDYNLEILFLTCEALAAAGVTSFWYFQKSISILKLTDKDKLSNGLY